MSAWKAWSKFTAGRARHRAGRPVSLEQTFDTAEDERVTDADKVRSLCGLTNFDVHSLRIQLCTLGIDVDDIENLRLSEEKRS